jgi:hypothetical protein
MGHQKTSLSVDLTFIMNTSMNVVWLHGSHLRSNEPALAANPDAAVLFIFDIDYLKSQKTAFHRLQFIYEGVLEVYQNIPNPIKEIHLGRLVDELLDFAQKNQASQVHTTVCESPEFRATVRSIEKNLPVTLYETAPLIAGYAEEPVRFSRYWRKVGDQVLGYPPEQKGFFHKNKR